MLVWSCRQDPAELSEDEREHQMLPSLHPVVGKGGGRGKGGKI